MNFVIGYLLRALKSIVPVAFAGFLLNGCYMPYNFDIEIEVTRGGFYSMIFDGYIVHVPLYTKIRNKELKSTEIRKEAEKYRKSLASDGSFTTPVKHIQQGIFQVHWERKGDILAKKFITFIARNENMLSLRYVKTDGTIRMAGATPSNDQRKQISQMGLDMTGQIRVITDAKVRSHNATRFREYPDKGPRFVMYTWEIQDIFTPSPQMIISLY